MTRIYDTDGTKLWRERDGSLVPDLDIPPTVTPARAHHKPAERANRATTDPTPPGLVCVECGRRERIHYAAERLVAPNDRHEFRSDW